MRRLEVRRLGAKTDITVVQLRDFLFGIDDQDLTVDELRAALFEVDDQDTKLDRRNINSIIKMYKK